MTLIMLCGQGSSGKSTFAKKLIKILSPLKTKIVSMDEVVGRVYDNNKAEEYYQTFINNIQCALESKEYDYIIIDQAFDTANSRGRLIKQMPMQYISNVIVVALRPGFQTIIQWDQVRKKRILQKEEKDKIETLYKYFQSPSEIEFINYPFLAVTTYEIDNSKITDAELKQIFHF